MLLQIAAPSGRLALKMNQIITINQSSIPTMSSREIAELTGKQHAHVMRDIRIMLEEIGGQSKFGSTYRDAQDKLRAQYSLPKRETLILVSGYNVELRARIIDRWMELEQQAQGTAISLPDFSNPAIAARAWAEQFEQRPERAVSSAKPLMKNPEVGSCHW